MKVRNPRSGAYDYEIAPDSPADVAAVATRLRAAQPAWEALGALGRGAVLERFAKAVERHAGAIIAALAIDTGRTKIAQVEVFSLIGTLRRWIEHGPTLLARLDCTPFASATPGIEVVPRYSAYPLFGAICPWNFPVILSHIDAIPALMAGCAALVKPSEVTPRCVAPLRAALGEVPELGAVFAYVEGGPESGQAVIEVVDYVCFTGSTATGRKVAQTAARCLIPVNLELGGKDPMIVLASADPVSAAHTALRSSVAATGQACQSIERVYVARAIAEPFLTELVSAANDIALSFPDPAAGHIGPFIFAEQADKVAVQIAAAVAGGATVLTGGHVETLGGGKYLRPTVLTGVTPDMAIIAEETFGPVIPVVVFDDPAEAIVLANQGTYGLSAAVLAGDVAEAEAVGSQLDAGAISINDGSLTAMVWDAANEARRGSGLGPSRMGDEGLLRFVRRQSLIRQLGTPPTLAMFAEDAS